ncbi:O-antigen translocase [Bradyrhizobium sp. McL0616]|uniref:O-antigen translocase n=1 Tax=Bradyrhizobium sp. McL0616 TaxID=3415674 RepID=UPI003CEA61B7
MIVKLVASFAGPEGVGKLGQLLSVISLLAVFGGGGIGSGIVKYVAELRNSVAGLKNFLGSAAFFTIMSSFFIVTGALVFRRPLTLYLLQDDQYQVLITILALTQPFIAANAFFISVLTGCGDIRRVSLAYTVSAVMSVVLAGALGIALHSYGALLALVGSQTLAFFVTLFFVVQSPHRELFRFRISIDRAIAAKLFQFSMMSLASAVLPHFVGLWIRDHLAEQLSWREVGYWQAVGKISEAYLLFFTVPIASYYVPKVSAITAYRSFKREITNAFVHIVPAVILIALLVYVFRSLVLRVLFSEDFAPAESLFLPQLVGDVIKVTSFIFSYVMVARAMTMSLIVAEVLFSVNYVFLVAVLTPHFGLMGAMYAFVVNYACYLACVGWFIWRYVRSASWSDLPRAEEQMLRTGDV